MTTASNGTPLTVLFYDGQGDSVQTTGGAVVGPEGATTFPATLSSTGTAASARVDFYDGTGTNTGVSQFYDAQLFDTQAHASSWISSQSTSHPSQVAVAAFPT